MNICFEKDSNGCWHKRFERDALARSKMSGFKDWAAIRFNYRNGRVRAIPRNEKFSDADPKRADNAVQHSQGGTKLVVLDLRQEALGTAHFIGKLAQAAAPI